MKCPYCKKFRCEPEVVSRNCETYGSCRVNFKCLHCKEVITVFGERRVVFGKPEETDGESDWE